MILPLLLLYIVILLFNKELTIGLKNFNNAIKDSYIIKYRIYNKPSRAVPQFCKQFKPIKSQIGCRVELYWKVNNLWRSVCNFKYNHNDFPQRFYKLKIQCYLFRQDINNLSVSFQFKR